MPASPDPKALKAERTLEAERCRRAPHYFIFESGHLRTRDEHDPHTPVKPVPDIPYLRVLLDLYLVSGKVVSPEDAKYALAAGLPLAMLIHLHETGVVLVEKSRDMFVTNLTSAYLLWRGRALDHQLILLQSKKEEDAAKLVFIKEPQFARLSFMEDRLPPHLRVMTWPRAGAYGNLYAPNGSQWRAIPEGGHIIRSEHPSVIFSDEAAFQAEYGASFTAAMPAVEGGGQYIAISSAEPGEFEELVNGTEGENTPTTIPGLSWRLASDAVFVLRLHYAADPAKRPGTIEGETWREKAAQRYPGGTASPRWRKELEIEYRAFSGVKVFPRWELWAQGPPFVIPAFAPTGYRLYGSYDHGWNNPAAFYVHGVGPDGDKVTLWEFYADHVPVSAIAKIMKGEDVLTPPRSDARIEPGRLRFPGCPYAGTLTWTVADPSLWAEDQPMNDNTNKSIAWLFQRHGVFFQKGERGGDSMVAEWILGDLWADPEHPRWRIVRDCRWLIWELGQLRYKEHSPHVMLTKNVSEVFVDKNDHAWDSTRMFLQRFPPDAAKPRPEQKGGTFAWFRDQAKRAQRGQPVQSFRREMVG